MLHPGDSGNHVWQINRLLTTDPGLSVRTDSYSEPREIFARCTTRP